MIEIGFENLRDSCLFAVGAMYGDHLHSREKLAAMHQAKEESLAWFYVPTEEVDSGGVEIGLVRRKKFELGFESL